MRNTFSRFGLAVLVLGSLSATATKAVTITPTTLGTLAGPVTTSGTLANQGVALEATFSLSSATQLMIYTTSYGGGPNANGSTAAPGGFMPSLVLYNSSGAFVAGETFPSPTGVRDSATGLVGDAYIRTSTLAAGSYIVTVSDYLVQQAPTATNLSDGFINYGSGTSFSDVQGNLRTGNYNLNLSGASTTAAPEPATFALLGPLFGGFAFWAYRHRNTN
jgi:hypothetical protein